MTNKPHKHAELIKAWADGAEIEWKYDPTGEWKSILISPSWCSEFEYRIKPVIKKMYMHYDTIEYHVDQDIYPEYVNQKMFRTNEDMEEHLEFTFTNGKLTSVEMKHATN